MKLYRCWIMWHKSLVMIIPSILSLAFLGANLLKITWTDFQTNFKVCIIATSLTTLCFQIIAYADNGPLPDWYFSAVTAFFFLSLGVNTLVTSLIVYKIVTVYHDIRGFKSHGTSNGRGLRASAYGVGQRDDLYPLISILIESGLITFVGQLVQSIMYKSAPDAFPLVGGCVVMLYVRGFLSVVDLVLKFHLLSSQGISTTVVLVRVEMGITYDRNTSVTAYSTKSRHSPSIQLGPFAAQVTQTTTILPDVEAPDEPNDVRSVRNLSGIRPNWCIYKTPFLSKCKNWTFIIAKFLIGLWDYTMVLSRLIYPIPFTLS